MIRGSGHHIFAVCNNCTWRRYYGKAPLKSSRDARRHAVRNPDHYAYLIDLTALTVIQGWRFPAPLDLDQPPF
jgi:hypothetical protein